MMHTRNAAVVLVVQRATSLRATPSELLRKRHPRMV